jgi:hypothetical protein
MIIRLSPYKCTLYDVFRFSCKTETYVTHTAIGVEYYVGSTYKCYILFVFKVWYLFAWKVNKACFPVFNPKCGLCQFWGDEVIRNE